MEVAPKLTDVQYLGRKVPRASELKVGRRLTSKPRTRVLRLRSYQALVMLMLDFS